MQVGEKARHNDLEAAVGKRQTQPLSSNPEEQGC